jgi:hypothetical protein
MRKDEESLRSHGKGDLSLILLMAVIVKGCVTQKFFLRTPFFAAQRATFEVRFHIRVR